MVVRGILLALLCLTSSSVANAQNFVVLDPGVRAELAKAWDTHNPRQPERAYCATYRTAERWDVPVYRVTRIHRARVTASSPSYIIYFCAPGEVQIHTHPPTTCDDKNQCRFGGPDAYECFPSEIDVLALSYPPAAPFALIQCDKHAVVFYFPNRAVSAGPGNSLNRMVQMQR